MSALPFTPLTITPRPTESRRPNSPSPREGAGGWVPDATFNTASSEESDAYSPSQREGGRPFVHSDPDLAPPHPVTPSPSHAPAPLFSPDETTAAAIIDDFAGQDENLRGIADKYDTTLESLTLWLARPDIKEAGGPITQRCATTTRCSERVIVPGRVFAPVSREFRFHPHE